LSFINTEQCWVLIVYDISKICIIIFETTLKLQENYPLNAKKELNWIQKYVFKDVQKPFTHNDPNCKIAQMSINEKMVKTF
jgi:hypothetical protein